MEEIKEQIIEIYEKNNENFKKKIKRELSIENEKIINNNILKNREILFYTILEIILSRNEELHSNKQETLSFIEETLFTYLNS